MSTKIKSKIKSKVIIKSKINKSEQDLLALIKDLLSADTDTY